MTLELLQLLKNEAKIQSNYESRGVYWARRKEEHSTTRHRRRRAKRQTDLSKRTTEQPEVDDSPRKVVTPVTSRISVGESGKEAIGCKWSGATGGPPAEVILRLHPTSRPSPSGNFTMVNVGQFFEDLTYKARDKITYIALIAKDGGVVVRAEEALIVTFVLLLWVAAIALFFNRWGKIRMLEPYQPKFQQQHRQSCVLADNTVSVPPHHRASLSRGCVSYDYGPSFSSYQPYGYLSHRPRQNSVFVGSVGGMALIPESPPRRSRSAADLPALVPPTDISHTTPRSSRAASLHSAVDLRVYVPSPRTSRAASLHSTVDMPGGTVQVHARGSGSNLNRPKSPRRLTITNV